jgi:hypothetical protein
MVSETRTYDTPRYQANSALEPNLWVLLLVTFAGHEVVNLISPYGFQRDEFLYLAMGDHLRWWRMDFPPFIALASNITRGLFGTAIWSIRLLPALAAALVVVMAAVTVRAFAPLTAAAASDGAAPRARWLAWLAPLAVLTSPVFLRSGNLFQPVVFDQLWWTAALLSLAMRQLTGNVRWWLAVGAALGLGLLTKFSIVFIGVGIVTGVLLTPMRRDLLTPWPWLALLLALAIGAPSLVGQMQLDFPIRWQMRDLQAGQLGRRSYGAFLAEQLPMVGPMQALLALVGLGWLLMARAAAPVRAVGIAVLVSWIVLTVQRGKGYYGAPVYPTLYAAGAVAVGAVALRRRWFAPTAALLMVAYALGALPVALPILSPARTAAWAAALGETGSTRTNYGTTLPLPQDFADMLGWPEQVAAVGEEWNAMPQPEQQETVLAATNYGRAGALDFYGAQHRLPRVVSGAGSYWFFGPGEKPGTRLLILGAYPEQLSMLYKRCTLLREVRNAWGVEEERVVPITRCEGPRQPLQAAWPSLNPALERE